MVQNQVDALIQQANVAIVNGDTEDALLILTKSLDQEMDAATRSYLLEQRCGGKFVLEKELFTDLATVYLMVNDFELAMIDIEMALQLDSKRADAMFRKALVLSLMDKHDEAIQQLEYLLQQHPTHRLGKELLKDVTAVKGKIESQDGIDKLPVTVLSGFLGAGKTTLLKNILENKEGLRIAVIVNDMAEVNIDAELVKSNGESDLFQVEEGFIEMTNGCVCCTLRNDLLVEVARLAKLKKFDYLVVESSGISEPLPVAQTFTFQDQYGNSLSSVSKLDTLVTVIDSLNFQSDVAKGELLNAKKIGVDENDTRDISTLLIDQIEFANVIVLNKIDLVSEEKLSQLRKVIEKLNPEAKIVETSHSKIASLNQVLNTGLFDYQKAINSSGWVKELLADHTPETQEYGVTSFVYKRRLPFHPEKLWSTIEKLPSVIRSKGFFWLGTDFDDCFEWSSAGSILRFHPKGKWIAARVNIESIEQTFGKNRIEIFKKENKWELPHGDRRQEIVFIGTNLNKKEIEDLLDSTLLSEDEVVNKEQLALMSNPFRKVLEIVRDQSMEQPEAVSEYPQLLKLSELEELNTKKSEMKDDTKNIAIVERSENSDLSQFLDRYLAALSEAKQSFPNIVNKKISVSEARNFVETKLRSVPCMNEKLYCAIFSSGLSELLDDIERNVRAVAMLDAQDGCDIRDHEVSLTLKLVDDDMCSKYHHDSNYFRLLCTYKGPGTEWVPNEVVERHDNHVHVTNVEKVQKVEQNWIVILKGLFRSQSNAAVHRSPPLKDSEVRILLRVDSIPLVN